ncbi:hypothetical protein [Streptomyces sp. NPDC056049]|uniref:hypothetical protein n=1 Tax=Streptomyces sp. NPDC056049 TaxID=3345693 RepID=UPI0035DC8907
MPDTTPRGYEYPLYSDTQNFPAQIQALAEDIDADVQSLYDADQAARNAPSASLGLTGPIQLIPTGAITTVQFSFVEYDNAGMATLPSNIAIVETGLYLVTGGATFLSAATGGQAVLLRSVGGLVPDIATVTKAPATSVNNLFSLVALTRCAAGETITMAVLQNSGAGSVLQDAQLSVTKVAP